jgi:hypothetical protein
MHCDCCDALLTDYEATLRHAHTGEFLNTCNKCLKGLSIPKKGRSDLKHQEKTPVEDFYKEVFFDDEDD